MKEITINKRNIQVRKILVKDLPSVSIAVAPFFEMFGEITKDGQLKHNELFKLCAMHADDVVNLCVVMTDCDKEFLRHLEPKQLFDLTKEIIALSNDFFLAQVIEPLNEMSKILLQTAILTNIGLKEPSNA